MKRFFCLLLVFVLVLSLGLQASAEPAILFCRLCGERIPPDSLVCQYCGAAVVHADGSDASAAQESAAQTQHSSPATLSAPASSVPGPFNTIIGENNTSRVRVTKSPTSESVPYGGSCIFIAHALNADSITWYLANSDASAIIPASEASAYASGLSVTGYNSDTLSLSGIPSWMNGYQVQACFDGEGGPVYTEIARIWTYEEVKPHHPCNPWAYWMEYGCPPPWWELPQPPSPPPADDVTTTFTVTDAPAGDWSVRPPVSSEG